MATIRFMLESERDYDSVTDMSFRLTGVWVQNEDDWSDLDMYPIPGEESSIMALEDLRIKARITDNEVEVPPDFSITGSTMPHPIVVIEDRIIEPISLRPSRSVAMKFKLSWRKYTTRKPESSILPSNRPYLH